MKREMIQSEWFWPALIVLSAGLAGSLAFTNSTLGLRPLAAVWFLLVCPGMAFVRMLPIKEVATQWTLAVALSMALDALVASILVYAHIWSPNVALVILIVTSLAGVSLQVIPEKWLSLRKSPKISLRAEGNGLLNRTETKSDNISTTNPRSVTSSIAGESLSIGSKAPTMSNPKILFIESEGIVLASLCGFMEKGGYKMQCAQSGDEALSIITEIEPDLILLDVVSPGIDGWETLQRLREVSCAPIIILTSNREKTDILRGFQLGADDYMMKPLSFAKLDARVAAVLSNTRTNHISKDIITSDELTIDFEQKQVIVDGQEVNLTPTEYRLIEALARHANRTIPLSELLSEVRRGGYEGEERAIKHFIWSLRKKIEPDPKVPKHLITRRGYGYRFE